MARPQMIPIRWNHFCSTKHWEWFKNLCKPQTTIFQAVLSCGQHSKGIVSNSAQTLTTILLMLLQRSEFGAASWHFSSNNNNDKGHGRCWSPTQQSAWLSGSSEDTHHSLARCLESPSIVHVLCRRKPDHENRLTLSENHSRFDSLWKVNIP